MARSAVNNGMRALEGLLARFFNDSIEPTIDSTGSANAYVFAANRTLAAYYDGMRISFHANFANTGAATLNVDAVGAKSIVRHHDVALESGDIEVNQIVEVVYSATDDTWQMVSPTATIQPADLPTATDTVVGGLETATQAELETNTAVDKITPPGRIKYSPHACKTWVNFDGTGTPAVTEGENVSSITDNGTGDYTVNFTTSLSTATYSYSFGAANVANNTNVSSTARAVGSLTIQATNLASTAVDPADVCVQIFGDF